MKSIEVSLISKYRTLLMGCAIFGIVFCHLDIAQIKHNIETSHLAMIFHLFTVGVDIFIFLSSFGLYYSFSKKMPKSYGAYIERRLKKIIPKYITIAGITGIISTIIIHKEGISKLVEDITFISWIKHGNTRYWFVAGIIMLYMFFPIIYKLLQTKCGESKLLLLVIAFLIITGIIEYKCSGQYSKFKILIERFPIFCLGAFIGKKSIEGKRYNLIYIVIIATIGVLGTALQYVSGDFNSFVVETHFVYYFFRGIFAFSIIITITVIMELLHKKTEKVSNLLESLFVPLGGITLEVYLFHQSYMILFDYPAEILQYIAVAVLLPIITAVLLKKGLTYLKTKV